MHAAAAELPRMLCGCKHECSANISFKPGEISIVDEPPMFQIEAASVNILGRRRELDQVHRLIDTSRLTHVYGP